MVSGMWRVLIPVMVLVYFAPGTAIAADYPPKEASYPTQMQFRNVLKESDIALGEVNTIIQDSEGFIWLGGRNGLLRFDGDQFVHVTIDTSKGDAKGAGTSRNLPISHAEDLLLDRDQRLWVATHIGLFLLDRDSNTLLAITSTNPDANTALGKMITSVEQISTGQILVGSHHGLILLEPNTLDAQLIEQIHSPRNELAGEAVFDIVLGENNVAWLGTETGLTRMDLQNQKLRYFIPYPEEPNTIVKNSAKMLEIDKQGKIWLGTGNSLYRFDPDTEVFTPYRHDPNDPTTISDNGSRDLYQDSKGIMWYGSRSGIDIYDFDKDQFIRVQSLPGQEGGLASSSVVSIYEDSIGDLWVGTYPSGANFHDWSSAAIRSYQRRQGKTQGILVDDVGAVIEDREGNLWVGAGGVTKIDRANNHFEYFSPEPSLIKGAKKIASGAILTGLQDARGDILFGTWANGLQKYSQETGAFEQLPFDTSISRVGPNSGTVLNDNVVWSLQEDRAGKIWMGTHHGGLNCYDPVTKTFTYYRQNPEDELTLSNQIVWTTLEDSQGRFWVGTANGLNLFDRERGTFKHYFKEDESGGLQNNSILSIYEDKKQQLWIGTDVGLHKYIEDEDTFEFYLQEDALADNAVRSIVEDKQGNLWIGTNNGIRMFNPETKVNTNFQSINQRKLGGFDTGSALVTRTGELAFGGEKGLKVIYPEQLTQSHTRELPVALTDFSLFTKSVAVNGSEKILTKKINLTEKIVLDHEKSMFSFRYAALNFRNPDKTLYAYMLEGFDDSWREVGNQRIATYTNIPSGNYTFKVKAKTSSNGNWTYKKNTVNLVIKPSPWRTWWAYLGYACLVALAFYFREKYRHLRKSAEEYKTQSITDSLTKIYNREGISQITSELYQNPELYKDIAVIMIDVDHFKKINDQWGHDVGDYVLSELARTISQNIREDDYIGRWGGEELIVICPGKSQATARFIAEKIRLVVADNAFESGSKKLTVTVSIGIAITYDKESFEQVFKRADTALYQAKATGRNRVVMAGPDSEA